MKSIDYEAQPLEEILVEAQAGMRSKLRRYCPAHVTKMARKGIEVEGERPIVTLPLDTEWIGPS